MGVMSRAWASTATSPAALGTPRGNGLYLGYDYRSGDESGGDDEAFDPLWGRWPQWSKVMIHQWPLDGRVGEATNLNRVDLGGRARPHPTAKVSLDYHARWAGQNTARTPAQLADLSRHARVRGHLITGWLKAKLAPQISGHLVVEYLSPGDVYADNRQDESHFVRDELNFPW